MTTIGKSKDDVKSNNGNLIFGIYFFCKFKRPHILIYKAKQVNMEEHPPGGQEKYKKQLTFSRPIL